MSAIVVRDLRYRYASATTPAVDGVSFDVSAGEIFGFLGPSGAGKSTTQKILIRLLRRYDGVVTVLGRELRRWGNALYERIGVSFELPNHYGKLTAAENLTFFASLFEGPTAAPDQLLARVDLLDDADTRVASFSKGMQMRLNLARALIGQPDLLFLDEPTSGLDPVTARRVKQVILEEREAGRTVFLTTHDMTLADELCDRVAFLVDGRFVALDTPRALKLRSGHRTVAVDARSDGGFARYEFDLDGLADDPQFLSLLRSGEVETIHTQEATLEQVFVEVTGRSLR